MKINGRDEHGEGRAGHVSDAGEDLARQRHDRAPNALQLRSQHGGRISRTWRACSTARSCLRPRSRGREPTGAPSHSMRATSRRSITGDPATLRFTHRRRRLQAVLRIVRTLFGVPARDVEVGQADTMRLHHMRSASPTRTARRDCLSAASARAQPITAAGQPAQLDVRAAGERSIRITLKPVELHRAVSRQSCSRGSQLPFAGALVARGRSSRCRGRSARSRSTSGPTR